MKKPILIEEVTKIRSMMGLTESQMDMFAGTEDEAPAEDSYVGKRVEVYYNLAKHTFSVRYGGRVVLHADYVKLKDVKFNVRQGGKEQVRAEKQKNVHAFVIGILVDFMAYPATDIPSPSGSKVITYNPYKYDTFVYKDTEEPIMGAKEVEMINQPSSKIFQISEITQPMDEINLKSTGIKEFFDYINENPDAIMHLGFSSIQKLVRYVEDADIRDWDELRKELEDYKKLHGHEELEISEDSGDFKVSYTPEKIDEFIIEAKKDIELGKSLNDKFGSTIVQASLLTVYENLTQMNEAHSKVVKAEEYMRKKFNKFFDIVDAYEVGELPDNVRELEKLSDEIDNLSYSLSDLANGFEELINATNSISKNNKHLFTTQTVNQ